MAFKFSTGLRNALLGVGSLKAILETNNTTRILIYEAAGSIPASADDATSDTVLVTITNGSGDLTFTAPSAGVDVLAKDTGETWSGTVANTGVAAYFRLVVDTDDGTGASTTAVRIQGTIGEVTGDMILSDTSLTATNTQQIDYFAISFPTA